MIPRSLPPRTLPPNVPRPKALACRECNEAYGKAEEDLIMALGMCLNTENLYANSVSERVIRSMDAGAASTTEEAKRRLARRRSFQTCGAFSEYSA